MGYTGEIISDNYDSPFASRLRELSEENHFSQAHIAKYVGCSYQAIGAYMRGESVPKITDASKIADLFGVSTDYLIGKADCVSIDAENIYKLCGLDDAAISQLKELKLNSVHSSPDAMRIAIINDVITSPALLDALYNYVADAEFWGLWGHRGEVANAVLYRLCKREANGEKGDCVIKSTGPKSEDEQSLIRAINLLQLQEVLKEFRYTHSAQLRQTSDAITNQMRQGDESV